MCIWLVKENIENKKKEYLDKIGSYIKYIDSLSQYEEDKYRNNKDRKLTSFCDKILNSLKEVSINLSSKGFSGKVEYYKGYFIILYNGKYVYKNSNVSY